MVGAEQLGRWVGGAGGLDVGAARAVAALAVDAERNGGWEDRTVYIRCALRVCRALRVGVVAEHALGRDGALEVRLILAVVAGAHGPVAAALGVPAYGELDELAVGGAMEVAAGVVAGADDVVDALFHDVDVFAVGAGLGTSLEELAVAGEHGVVHSGELMVEGVGVGVVFDDAGGGWQREGSAHAGFGVGGGDVFVAGGALGGVDVAGLRGLG